MYSRQSCEDHKHASLVSIVKDFGEMAAVCTCMLCVFFVLEMSGRYIEGRWGYDNVLALIVDLTREKAGMGMESRRA